jgi:hypothetical protein
MGELAGDGSEKELKKVPFRKTSIAREFEFAETSVTCKVSSLQTEEIVTSATGLCKTITGEFAVSLHPSAEMAISCALKIPLELYK